MAPLLALVDFAAIANPDDEDAQCAVLNIGNDAIVADSIAWNLSGPRQFRVGHRA